MRSPRSASPSPSCRSRRIASPASFASAAPAHDPEAASRPAVPQPRDHQQRAQPRRSLMVRRRSSRLVRTLASFALASCVAAGADTAWAAETIRVGFMAPLTGIFAQAGKDMLEGLKLAFEQMGYQTAGRKIELIEEDDEGNPAVAQAKYRKLVTQDHIHVLTGVLLSNIGYGLIPPIEREQL